MGVALRDAFGTELQTAAVSVAYSIPPAESPRPSVEKPKVLGTLGNLGHAKSLDVVIDTFEQLSDEPAAQLLLGGPIVDDAGREWLGDAVDKHRDRIRHVGPVSGADKDAFLAELDVFLFPSRHLDESFGLVVVEALQTGIPVIMVPNRCFGAVELGTAGRCIADIDKFPELAADQVREWMNNPDIYRTAQRAAADLGRRHVAQAHAAAEAHWLQG
jgi:glycosyltransferase involved in cell wall biosynthesis